MEKNLLDWLSYIDERTDCTYLGTYTYLADPGEINDFRRNLFQLSVVVCAIHDRCQQLIESLPQGRRAAIDVTCGMAQQSYFYTVSCIERAMSTIFSDYDYEIRGIVAQFLIDDSHTYYVADSSDSYDDKIQGFSEALSELLVDEEIIVQELFEALLQGIHIHLLSLRCRELLSSPAVFSLSETQVLLEEQFEFDMGNYTPNNIPEFE